jgi:hypothetical protein
MPRAMPLFASARDRRVRQVRIPEKVRLACQHIAEMGIGYADAAKLVGLGTEQMRKWLFEPAVRSLITAERNALINAICAASPVVLAAIRDNPEGNQAARVRAAVALEDMHNAEAAARQPASSEGPRFQLSIVTHTTAPSAVTIDAHPIMPTVPHAFPTRAPVPPSEPLPYVPDAPIEELQPLEAELRPIFKYRRPGLD